MTIPNRFEYRDGQVLHAMSYRYLRVAPWQGDPKTALMGPARGRRGPEVDAIRQGLERLRRKGVTTVVTPALSHYEAEPFFQAGFTLHERLHLLAKNLSAPDPGPDVAPIHPPPDDLRISTARMWHRRRMLDVDERAFQGFWQFDAVSLGEALNATPQYWARVAVLDGRTVGYAITGRAGDRGYLQRLAVVPEAQGKGVGSTLVNDAIAWLRHRRASLALVNTQEINERAFDLYQRHGFVRQSEGLIVLRWST
ncbi:MAG: GNAT family N-acetyltransferase [Acidimicrobiia bacterium]|nr:GNAT family N-acetyltransferase [Acidimicrobiia bacterium]MDH5520285.1 GNAT family N-acetyltransferase [Acidimicrobiia bacterium]